MKKRALISVSDKTGILELACELAALGYEIISTGGTFKMLTDNGIAAISVSDITFFPECLDGRVKTLHPAVHAGLLAMRSNKEHMEQLQRLNINTIDVVVVNLYPFKAAISKPHELSEAVENIDIGGPTMLRSAAKNYQDVVVLVDPKDYGRALEEMKNGGVTLETKFYLMYKVFQHTAVYDTLVSTYIRERQNIRFPEQFTLAFEKKQELRYGENPHQNAAYYQECLPITGAITDAVQLHGKELSYNNINDSNGALDLLREFDEPAAVAVKHANPCGVGVADNIYDAYMKAYNADPVSIFGGILALNRPVDKAIAEEVNKFFLEIIIAPDFTDEAMEILTKKQNIRVMKLDGIDAPVKPTAYDMKKVSGGLLAQDYDTKVYDSYEVVTEAKPTEEQLKDLLFAMKVVKHSKSNAIALAKDGASVGIGVGQTNRIRATNQAIEHAGNKNSGTVLASDAFFPFSDCVEAAAAAGIKAIAQPSGSKNDADSVAACNKYGIAMIFTHVRHFKH